MAVYTLQQLQAIISPIAKRHGVKRVSVFGSYGRGQATASSDVDLSIEKGKIQTMLQYFAFVNDVQDALKCHVDVITPDIRDKSFLETIRKDEVKIFEQ